MKNIARKTRRGFTFLEMMFVVVIIGILLALVGPQLAGRTETARIVATQGQLKMIEGAIKTFEMDTGSYPGGLKDLVEKPSDSGDEWRGSYLDSDALPEDAFHRAFEYKYPGDHNRTRYDLWSKGPDKQSNTKDDITNWKKAE